MRVDRGRERGIRGIYPKVRRKDCSTVFDRYSVLELYAGNVLPDVDNVRCDWLR
jgi:hypothetical protein